MPREAAIKKAPKTGAAEELKALKNALRDVVALATLPAAWVGRDPRQIADSFLGVLMSILHLETAFVRLCDPADEKSIESYRCDEDREFVEWVRKAEPSINQVQRQTVLVRALANGGTSRVVFMPIGIHGEAGLVAITSPRDSFPNELDSLLLSVAANHAGTAFRTAQMLQKNLQTAEVLRQKEELTRRILDSSPDCIKLVARDGTLRYLNDGGVKVMELDDPGALLGKEWTSFWQGEYKGQAAAAFTAALQGQDGRFQGCCATATGLLKWWDVALTPLLDGYGKVEEVLIISRDISTIRDAEEVVKKNDLRFRNMVQSITDAFVAIDRDFTITFVNDNGAGLLQRSREELVGYNLWKLFPEAVDTPFFHNYQRAMQTGAAVHFEEYYSPLKRWFEVHAYPSSDGLAVFFRDISERKRSEALLRDREAELRVLANTMPQLSWMANPDGHIFWYNDRWYQYTGTTPKEMEGWGWQSVHHAKELPRVLEAWKGSLASGQPFEMTFPLRSAQGNFRWFLTRVNPIRDESGNILRWFGTNTDVQELREAQQRLRLSEERLRITQQAAGIGSWELNLDTEEFFWTEEVFKVLSIPQSSPLATFNDLLGLMYYSSDRENAVNALAAARRKNKGFHVNFRVRGPGGEPRIISGRGRSFYNQGESLILGVFIDVTGSQASENRNKAVARKASGER